MFCEKAATAPEIPEARQKASDTVLLGLTMSYVLQAQHPTDGSRVPAGCCSSESCSRCKSGAPQFPPTQPSCGVRRAGPAAVILCLCCNSHAWRPTSLADRVPVGLLPFCIPFSACMLLPCLSCQSAALNLMHLRSSSSRLESPACSDPQTALLGMRIPC